MTTRSHHRRGVRTIAPMGPRTLGQHKKRTTAIPPNVRCPTCGVLMRRHKRCLACRVLVGYGHANDRTAWELCEGCLTQQNSGEGGAAIRVRLMPCRCPEGDAMITDFYYAVQHWRLGDVIHLRWGYDGKDVQVYLFAKNGRHYSMPKPPDDPLVEYLMSDFGMKVSAARLLARRVPKGTEEERILAVHRMYDREGKA